MVCAYSELCDSLSHRSFAGLTIQTHVHHNNFDKWPGLVYNETHDPRSNTAGIRADMINTAFLSDWDFFVETAISTAAEWNQCALSSLMKVEIWYEHGQFVGNVFHFLAHTV